MNARSLASHIRRQHVTLASRAPAVRPAAMRLSALLAAQRLLPAHGGQQRAFYDALTFARPTHRSALRARPPVSMLVTQAYANAPGMLESAYPRLHVSGESTAHVEESPLRLDSPAEPDTHASAHVLARRFVPAASADIPAPVVPASEQALEAALAEGNSPAPFDPGTAAVRPSTMAAAADGETQAPLVGAAAAGGRDIGPASSSGSSLFASTPEPGRTFVQRIAGLVRVSASRGLLRAPDPLALVTRSAARGSALLSASAQAGRTWESPLLQRHAMVLGRAGLSRVLRRQAALPGVLPGAVRNVYESAATSAVGEHSSASTQTDQDSGTAPVAPAALISQQRNEADPSELPIQRSRQTAAVTRDGGSVQATATPYAHRVPAERWRAELSLPAPISSPGGGRMAASTAPLRVTGSTALLRVTGSTALLRVAGSTALLRVTGSTALLRVAGSTALLRVAAIPMRAASPITPEHLSRDIVRDGVLPLASGVLSRRGAVSRPSSPLVVAPTREPDSSAGAFPQAPAITYIAPSGATDHAEVALSHAPIADIAPTLADAAGQVPLVRAESEAPSAADGNEDILSTAPPLEHRYVRRYIQRVTDAELAHDDVSDLVARETTSASETARSDRQSEQEEAADLPLHSAAAAAESGVSGRADARAGLSLPLSSAASSVIARAPARDLRLAMDMPGALPSHGLAPMFAQRAGAAAIGSRAGAGFGSFQHDPIASPMIWRRMATTDQPIIVSASPLQDRMASRDFAGTAQVYEHADRTDLHEGLAVVGKAQQSANAITTAPLLATTGVSIRRAPAGPFTFMNVSPRFAGAAAEHAAGRGHADMGAELFPFTPVYRAEAAQAPTAASAGSTAAVPAASATAGAPTAGPGAVDLDELAERTLRKLVRMVAIEKERRGVTI